MFKHLERTNKLVFIWPGDCVPLDRLLYDRDAVSDGKLDCILAKLKPQIILCRDPFGKGPATAADLEDGIRRLYQSPSILILFFIGLIVPAEFLILPIEPF